MKLTRRELGALRHLDECCWEDAEQGGDGWCGITDFAETFGIKYAWASLLLATLRDRDLAESRPARPRRGKPLRYAPTEQGAALLHPTAKTKEPTQ